MALPSRRRGAWLAAVGGAAMTGIFAQASCLAVPPPTLSDESTVRPTILYEGTSPQPGVPMTEWPDGGFVVQVESQNQSFYWDAFLDYDPNGGANASPVHQPALVPVSGTNTDPVTVAVTTIKQPDPRFCHTVEILVAHQFNQNSAHVPDSVGGDIVTWFYRPAGAVCPLIDAGPYASGMFFDASSP